MPLDQPATIEELRRVIEPDMAAVDGVIRARLCSDVLLIRRIAEHIIHSGGKRLRPALVMLSARACGYEGRQHHELAAVVEFIHTATLLHDDVVDGSSLRRGQTTANALFGNSASVLVGDFLYSRAFQMMVSVNNMQVLQVLAEATNTIVEGEVMQLLNCHNADTDEASYLQVIRCKTAKLFEAATRLGALLAEVGGLQQQAMAHYGMHLGTAFQLIDDVLDYSGDQSETGKNIGDDLAEGKPTLPLIYAMRNGTPKQAQIIRNAIEGGGLDELDEVQHAIYATCALDYVRRQAQLESAAACRAISRMPHSKYAESLLQLANFAVNRDH
jgi:octaprenyl-diphosphate synthase